MHRILCSTGAVITRANGRDHRLLAGLAKELNCDGFEFMMYDSFYNNIDAIADELTSNALSFPAFHCEKSIGELIAAENTEAFSVFELNCRAAKQLGSGQLVLHLWNGLISDSNFDANLKAFGRLREIAAKYELLLTVENVICNNSTPMTHLYELADAYPDIAFTFDTKMAEFHGELDRVYDKTVWDNNIRHLHINDYSGGVKDWSSLRTQHLNCGHVDLDGFFEFVRGVDYQGDFTVEATSVNPDGLVDIAKLNADFDKIRGYIA